MNKPNEQRYRDLVARLEAHALLHNVDYLTDECIDYGNAAPAAADNIEFHEKLRVDDAAVWAAMFHCALTIAQFRLEDLGVPLLDEM